uniref:Uncharacterized protein n=1 Tax=Rhizophora mucronata TaxID=61149 RepID=A0A2P2IHD2_RHIMU
MYIFCQLSYLDWFSLAGFYVLIFGICVWMDCWDEQLWMCI